MSKYLSDFLRGSLVGTISSFTMVTAVHATNSMSSIPQLNFWIGVAGLLTQGLSLAYANYLSEDAIVSQKLNKDEKSPFLSALVTIISFILFGSIALSSLLMAPYPFVNQYFTYVSLGLTLLSFLIIGFIKSIFLGENLLSTGFMTLIGGGVVTGISYLVSYLLKAPVIV